MLSFSVSSFVIYVICLVSFSVQSARKAAFKVSTYPNEGLFHKSVLDAVSVSSHLECASFCSKEIQCKGYKYQGYSKMCFIRSAVDDDTSEYVASPTDFSSYSLQEVPNIQKENANQRTGNVTSYSCYPAYKHCRDEPTSGCQSAGRGDDVPGLCSQFRWCDMKNCVLPFPCGPSDRFNVTLWVTPVKEERFTVDIFNNTCILMHVDFRLNEFRGPSNNTLVLNSKRGNSWQKEHMYPLCLVPGREVSLSITVSETTAMVKVGRKFNVTYDVPIGIKANRVHIFQDVSIRLAQIDI